LILLVDGNVDADAENFRGDNSFSQLRHTLARKGKHLNVLGSNLLFVDQPSEPGNNQFIFMSDPTGEGQARLASSSWGKSDTPESLVFFDQSILFQFPNITELF
jgi:hypothetical protein